MDGACVEDLQLLGALVCALEFERSHGIGQIEQLAEKYGITEFSLENLYINGLISQTDNVKILGNGELKSKLTFKVNAVSDKAKSAIEAAGGTIEIVK